jgi:archaellum biogenesis ATPase FlaH
MANSLNPKSLQHLLEVSFPPQRWLIEGLVPLGGITLLSGAPESYKTWVMLDMAASVANGKLLFKKYPTTRTKVLLIDEESGDRILQERFKLLDTNDRSPIYISSMKDTHFTEEYVNELKKWCLKEDIGFIVIDSLSRIHRGDENTAKDISALFSHIKKLSNAGISIVILHHNRKSMPGFNNTANDIRGSSDILASVDCAIALSTTKTGFVNITQVKNRIALKVRPFSIKLSNDNDYLHFEFVSESKSKDDIRSDRKQAITSYIETHPSVNQTQITQYFGELDANFGGDKAIIEALHELVYDEVLSVTSGLKQAKHYTVNSLAEM